MRNRRGFSLMEMTIMIAVASMLFVGMGRAVQGQIKLATDNRDYLIALNLARKQMAVVNAGPTLSNGTTNPSDADFPGFTMSQVVSDVATDAANGGKRLYQIQLDVLRNGIVLVRLYTYRTDIVTFGTGS